MLFFPPFPFPNAPAVPPRCGLPPRGPPGPPPNPPPDPGPRPASPDEERYGEDGLPSRGRSVPGAPGRCGLAAKPGRTEPGRAPVISGLGGRCPGAKRCGSFPRAPGLVGRNAGRGPPLENGLFPPRGGTPPGRDCGGRGGRGICVDAPEEFAELAELLELPELFAAFGCELENGGAAGIFGLSARFAPSCNPCNPKFSYFSKISFGISAKLISGSFLVVFFAAAFLTGFGASSIGFKSGNLSINLRNTGASTVDEADRTNSPTSCNLASNSLLSSPNSFANS